MLFSNLIDQQELVNGKTLVNFLLRQRNSTSQQALVDIWHECLSKRPKGTIFCVENLPIKCKLEAVCKGSLFSESAMCLSNLQEKYSKLLS